MNNPTLTLHEPWASLVACGLKTIETRSWSTKYRGPLFIHSAAKRFGFNSERADVVRDCLGNDAVTSLHNYRRLGRFLWVQQFPNHAKTASLDARSDPELCDNYPLGKVIAVATLSDCVPMVDGMLDLQPPCLIIDPPIPYKDKRLHGILTYTDDSRGTNSRDVTNQRDLGDFTPGRFAWILDNVRILTHPKEAKGMQRIWDWKEGPFQPTNEGTTP